MSRTNTETATDLRARGIECLRKGDARAARALLERSVAANDVDVSAWMGLAFASARLADSQATLVAIDKALSLEPYNIRALLFKADHLSETGQSRRALVFYKAALKIAAGSSQIPADVSTGLQRAQDRCNHYAAEYEDYLLEQLTHRGYSKQSSHPRFQQALDIAFGKTDIYHQQPTRFYYPELPQIQFYPRDAFPWLESLEAATDRIREELLAVMQHKDSFSPYLTSDADTVQFNDTSNVDSNEWGAFFFYEGGERIEQNASRCPLTMQALSVAPLPHIPGNTPHALYSKLAGGAKIPPHTGLINTRLICHLPLLVPENCGALRCGNQIQQWVEGKAYVFDDSIEHEAWNNGTEDRVVLLFDIWRPELDTEERELISGMLQAVQAYEANTEKV